MKTEIVETARKEFPAVGNPKIQIARIRRSLPKNQKIAVAFDSYPDDGQGNMLKIQEAELISGHYVKRDWYGATYGVFTVVFDGKKTVVFGTALFYAVID